MSIYTDEGFKNRTEYLESLADEYIVEVALVLDMASILGPDEDFDGLLTTLQDYADGL